MSTSVTMEEWNYIDMTGLGETIRLALKIEKHLQKYPESKRAIRDAVMELTEPPKRDETK